MSDAYALLWTDQLQRLQGSHGEYPAWMPEWLAEVAAIPAFRAFIGEVLSPPPTQGAHP